MTVPTNDEMHGDGGPAPWQIKIFGAPGRYEIKWWVKAPTAEDYKREQELKRLFPEANVKLVADRENAFP